MTWPASLIGKPWRLGASGPDAFDCWGLVRHCVARMTGLEMPAINTASPSSAAIRAVAGVGEWRRVDDTARHGDIVLMRSAIKLHCGIVMDIGRIGVLHCANGIGVVFERYADATRGMAAEVWRMRA